MCACVSVCLCMCACAHVSIVSIQTYKIITKRL